MAARVDLLTPRARYALEVLKGAMEELGFPVWVTSTFRDRSEQAALYARFLKGQSRYPVARPGTSRHESGQAFDIGTTEKGYELAAFLAPHIGLRWGGTFRRPDKVHFEVTA